MHRVLIFSMSYLVCNLSVAADQTVEFIAASSRWGSVTTYQASENKVNFGVEFSSLMESIFQC